MIPEVYFKSENKNQHTHSVGWLGVSLDLPYTLRCCSESPPDTKLSTLYRIGHSYIGSKNYVCHHRIHPSILDDTVHNGYHPC